MKTGFSTGETIVVDGGALQDHNLITPIARLLMIASINGRAREVLCLSCSTANPARTGPARSASSAI
jgi:hypothetical protein